MKQTIKENNSLAVSQRTFEFEDCQSTLRSKQGQFESQNQENDLKIDIKLDQHSKQLQKQPSIEKSFNQSLSVQQSMQKNSFESDPKKMSDAKQKKKGSNSQTSKKQLQFQGFKTTSKKMNEGKKCSDQPSILKYDVLHESQSILRLDHDNLNQLMKSRSPRKGLKHEFEYLGANRKLLKSEKNLYEGLDKDKEKNQDLFKDDKDNIDQGEQVFDNQMKTNTNLQEEPSKCHFDTDVFQLNRQTIEIQGKFLEKWLNDILEDAGDFGVPGFISTPEHFLPIIRYGLDRQSLLSFQMSRQKQDELYRALYVHTVGFYQFLRQITHNMTGGKERLISSIWKVFQIVLECACKTDYKMITKRMEENNMIAINQLAELNQTIVKRGYEREEELKNDLNFLVEAQRQCNEIQAQLKMEKVKMDRQIYESQKKCEDETLTRIHFENKVNFLHNLNMTLESNNLRINNQNLELKSKLKKLEIQYQKALDENKTLQITSVDQQNRKNELASQAEISDQIKIDLQKQMQQMLNIAEFKKDETAIMGRSLQEARIELLQKTTYVKNLEEKNRIAMEQIKQLNNQSQISVLDMDTLNEKIKTLTSQIYSNEKELVQIKVEKEMLIRDVDGYKREIASLKEQAKNLQVQNLQLHVQKSTTDLTLKQLNQQNKKFNDTIIDQSEAIYQLSALKSSLQTKLVLQMTQCDEQIQSLDYLSQAYVTARKVEHMASKKNDNLNNLFAKVDAKLETVQQKYNIVEMERDEIKLQNSQQFIKIEALQKKLAKANATNTNQIAYWQSNLKKERLQKENAILQINVLNQKIGQLTDEIQELGKKNNQLLMEQTDFSDKHEMVLLENKSLKDQIKKTDKLNKRAEAIIQQRTDAMKLEAHRKQMVMEDQLNRNTWIRINQLKELKQLRVQNHFLAKKYIAFILLKGWSTARRKQFSEEVQRNKQIMSVQEKSIQNQLDEVQRASYKMECAELQIKKVTNMLDEKNDVIKELQGDIQLKEFDIKKLRQEIAKYTKQIRNQKQFKLPVMGQPGNKQTNSIGTDTSMDFLDSQFVPKKLSSSNSTPQSNKDYIMEKKLQNIESKEIIDYTEGQEVPSGWKVIEVRKMTNNIHKQLGLGILNQMKAAANKLNNPNNTQDENLKSSSPIDKKATPETGFLPERLSSPLQIKDSQERFAQRIKRMTTLKQEKDIGSQVFEGDSKHQKFNQLTDKKLTQQIQPRINSFSNLTEQQNANKSAVQGLSEYRASLLNNLKEQRSRMESLMLNSQIKKQISSIDDILQELSSGQNGSNLFKQINKSGSVFVASKKQNKQFKNRNNRTKVNTVLKSQMFSNYEKQDRSDIPNDVENINTFDDDNNQLNLDKELRGTRSRKRQPKRSKNRAKNKDMILESQIKPDIKIISADFLDDLHSDGSQKQKRMRKKKRSPQIKVVPSSEMKTPLVNHDTLCSNNQVKETEKDDNTAHQEEDEYYNEEDDSYGEEESEEEEEESEEDDFDIETDDSQSEHPDPKQRRRRNLIKQRQKQIPFPDLEDTNQNKIYKYFQTKDKDNINDLIQALNRLPQIKVCGNLGMCFNCRNKDLKMIGSQIIAREPEKNQTEHEFTNQGAKGLLFGDKQQLQSETPVVMSSKKLKNGETTSKKPSQFMMRSESTPSANLTSHPLITSSQLNFKDGVMGLLSSTNSNRTIKQIQAQKSLYGTGTQRSILLPQVALSKTVMNKTTNHFNKNTVQKPSNFKDELQRILDDNFNNDISNNTTTSNDNYLRMSQNIQRKAPVLLRQSQSNLGLRSSYSAAMISSMDNQFNQYKPQNGDITKI